MRHIFLIDPLEKLVVKKDSTLLLALEAKKTVPSFILFEKDFSINSFSPEKLFVYPFHGETKKDEYFIESFDLEDPLTIDLNEQDVIHMRLDPPFNMRYMQILWKLMNLKALGITVINDPQAIAIHNEKLFVLQYPNFSIPTLLARSTQNLKDFTEQVKKQFHGLEYLIVKPVDLYQGLGVKKIFLDQSEKEVLDFISEYKMAVIQPYLKEIEQGEIRSVYFGGECLGNILKTPKAGAFLANVAQGASYKSISLNQKQKQACDQVSADLLEKGIQWIAYDLIGDYISEVNVTCPGLIVEVSSSNKINLAKEILKQIKVLGC